MGILRLTIEYDGGGFHGWARQPGVRTVEGASAHALDAIYPGGWTGSESQAVPIPVFTRPGRSRA